jgi:hypothetical protein
MDAYERGTRVPRRSITTLAVADRRKDELAATISRKHFAWADGKKWTLRAEAGPDLNPRPPREVGTIPTSGEMAASPSRCELAQVKNAYG